MALFIVAISRVCKWSSSNSNLMKRSKKIDWKTLAAEAYWSHLANGSDFVVAFLGACITDEFPCLVYALKSHGSLEEVLMDSRPLKYFSPNKDDVRAVIRMARDAAKGVVHLHSKRILHRDIACRNLLMDSLGQVW